MKTVLILAIGLVATLSLGAQSNEFLDQVLSEEELSYGSASYLVLASAGLIDADATAEDAVAHLEREGMGLPGKTAETPLTIGEYSYLLMQVYGLSGGMLYRIVPGPRYASRELSHRGIIQGRAYPGMSISAERGMRILGRVLQLDERGTL